jgi:acyl carrier protein
VNSQQRNQGATQYNQPAAQEVLTSWLSRYLADLMSLDAASVDLDMTFERYGMDSTAAVGLTGDLGNWLGTDVDAAATYDYPTIRQLAEALSRDPAVCAALAAHSSKQAA